MHIILETALGKGPFEYCNLGDVAMLQIAVTRLLEMWPSARLDVLTDSPADLANSCPGAEALHNAGRSAWFANGVLLGRYTGFLPEWTLQLLIGLKRQVRFRWPTLLKLVLTTRLKYRHRDADIIALEAFIAAMNEADLVILCGAGGFYEGCRNWSMEILDLIEAATRHQVPVVMLGQGFGPISDPIVLGRAKRVLPAVSLITLRGSPGGLNLLRSLGVDPSRVQTTGDEAIELAYEARSSKPGRGVGINLRFRCSAETDDGDIESIRPVIQEFARRHAVPLIPLPISFYPVSRDDLAIRRLLEGFDNESDGGATVDSPQDVIRQAGRCRVVVTGAYHAAVFALAQGIPVVGLAKSPYFASKFLGLEDQFGVGCQTVFLNKPRVRDCLAGAIEKAWLTADDVRAPLQQAALRQIELSRMAYKRVKDLMANLAKQQ